MDEELDETDEDESMEAEAEMRAEISQDIASDYGAPEPEEKINQHTIIKKAIDATDNIKTTFLTKGELGRPLFSMRFYLDCAKICSMYRAPKAARYFWNKAQIIAKSGMSNEGFTMKLAVTNKRDVTRTHHRKVSDEQDRPAP